MNEKMITTPDESDFKDWVIALNLMIANVGAALDYAQATTFCSDCPRSGRDCCKGSARWEEQYEPTYAYIDRLEKAKKAIQELIDEPK